MLELQWKFPIKYHVENYLSSKTLMISVFLAKLQHQTDLSLHQQGDRSTKAKAMAQKSLILYWDLAENSNLHPDFTETTPYLW